MNRDLIVDSVLKATQEVFATMLGLEVEPCPPYEERSKPGPSEGVVSLIGMAGTWIGTGCLSGSAGFACKVASLLVMSESGTASEAVDEDVLDAWAEVTNMVIGNVKTSLEERLGPMGLSIPTVIYGRNFSTRSMGNEEWTVVPFRSDGEVMEVRVCLAQAREPQLVRHGFSQMRPVHA